MNVNVLVISITAQIRVIEWLIKLVWH